MLTNPKTGRYKGLDRTTHGLSRSPEHNIWSHIKRRCLDPGNPAYHRYGGRGISVWAGWINDFAAFYTHVGPRPTPQHTIERIENNRGYEPGNVRWATRTEQARNTRANRYLTLGDVTLCIAEWQERLGFPPVTISRRLRDGWSIERTLTTPVRKCRKRITHHAAS